MRALIVEDEQRFAFLLQGMLKNHGICSDVCHSGYAGLQILTGQTKYNFVLLDYSLKDMEGVEFIQRARLSKENKHVPILIVSSSESRDWKIQALQIGADDYIVKTADKNEVMARIYSCVRRSSGFSANILKIGYFSLNLDSRQVFIDDNLLYLTGVEYNIFQLLMLRKNSPLSKEQILFNIYDQELPGPKIIDVAVCKIRKKIKQLCDALNIQIKKNSPISTRWGGGYQFEDQDESASLLPSYILKTLENIPEAIKRDLDKIMKNNYGSLPESILSAIKHNSKNKKIISFEPLRIAIDNELAHMKDALDIEEPKAFSLEN